MTQLQQSLPVKWTSLWLVVSLFVTSCAGAVTQIAPSTMPSQPSMATSQPAVKLTLLSDQLSFEPPQFLHKCILSAGDDRYCATEFEFRVFLHWLVSHESAVKLALSEIVESRDVWKERADVAVSQQGLSIAGVMGIIGSIVAALGMGFGVGYGVSLVKGK